MATFDFDVTRDRNVFGKKVSMTFKLTGGDNVSSGGETINPADIGLGNIEYFPPVVLNNGGSNIRWAYYDYDNSKIVYFSDESTEETGDLSTYSARVTVEGT